MHGREGWGGECTPGVAFCVDVDGCFGSGAGEVPASPRQRERGVHPWGRLLDAAPGMLRAEGCRSPSCTPKTVRGDNVRPPPQQSSIHAAAARSRGCNQVQVSFEASLHLAVSRGLLPSNRLRTPAGSTTGEEPGEPGPASHSHSHSHGGPAAPLASSSLGGRRIVLISGAWLGSEARRGVINPEKSAEARAEEEVGGGGGQGAPRPPTLGSRSGGRAGRESPSTHPLPHPP